MRLFKTNMLAVALLLFGAASASAYATNMTTSYAPGLTVSDSFTVSVHFDTEGASNVMLLSVGVEFDTTYLQYMGATSGSYMLYSAAVPMVQVAAWLNPAPSNGVIWGGASPAPPIQKVNLDWISNGFPFGGTYQTTAGDAYSDVLGQLTFHIIADGAHSLDVITAGNGNVLQLGDASQVANTPGPSIEIVPEPSTALLIGLGLVGLGVAGRKN
jgi:hypothetical protein